MQLLDPAKELPQVELGSCEYSGSEYTKLLKVMAVVPLLVRVNLAFELPVVPTVTAPKLKLLAESVNVGAVLPTPVRVMVEGLLPSESVITNVAERVPVVVGLKAV